MTFIGKRLTDAKMATELLKTEEINIVISSPYKRAVQTVEGIADYFDKEIEIEIEDDFRERILTTVPTEDFMLAISKVWEDYNFSWEGGESNIVAQKRGVNITFRILDRYQDKNIVIGTHGNIMALIMNYFDNKYDFTFWKNLDIPDIYKLTFDGRELKDVKKLWKRL